MKVFKGAVCILIASLLLVISLFNCFGSTAKEQRQEILEVVAAALAGRRWYLHSWPLRRRG